MEQETETAAENAAAKHAGISGTPRYQRQSLPCLNETPLMVR
jgi:hypothetical protein